MVEIYASELVTGGADPYDIVGAVRSLEGPLLDYTQGFVITDLRRIDYAANARVVTRFMYRVCAGLRR